MRVFLDTNVLVSAFATRGLCADVLTLVLAEHQLILGPQVLKELDRVLRRKLHVPPRRVAEVIAFLRAQASIVEATARPLINVHDPADARVLGEAMAGEIDVLVSGDRDLLDVASQTPFPIVTPRGFWEQLRGKGTK